MYSLLSWLEISLDYLIPILAHILFMNVTQWVDNKQKNHSKTFIVYSRKRLHEKKVHVSKAMLQSMEANICPVLFCSILHEYSAF